MNIKEQENKLRFSLSLEIYITLTVWLFFWGFVGYRLYKTQSVSNPPITIDLNVPTIKLSNLEVLRSSIRSVSFSNLPVVRIEPFD